MKTKHGQNFTDTIIKNCKYN